MSSKYVPTQIKVLTSSSKSGIPRSIILHPYNRVYGSFTMESIFAAAFGRVIEIQKGQSDTLTEAGAAIFSDAREYKTTSVVYSMMILSKREGRGGEGKGGEGSGGIISVPM